MKNIKIFTDMIEDAAVDQINTIAALDAFKDAKIRIMPDVHAGKGCVCGFTANLGDKVVPNLIGVDIGCGMLTICLGKVDIDLAELDTVIRKYVPAGKNVCGRPSQLADKLDISPKNCVAKFKDKDLNYFDRSIGSLGSGNHFVEIDIDEDGNKYLIIHTGSRNFGKKVCDYWQNVAVETLKEELTSDDVDSVCKELGV